MELTPEERATVDGAVGEHGMYDEKFAAIADVLQQFANDLAELKRVVMDELIGGVTKLYDENLRFEKIGGLKEKYGPLFGENEAAYNTLYDKPLWDALQDYLDENQVPDDAQEAEIKKLAEALKAKLEALKGGKAEEKAEEPATAVEVEVTKEAPPAEEEDPMKPVIDRIMKMKKIGRVPGIQGEPRD